MQKAEPTKAEERARNNAKITLSLLKHPSADDEVRIVMLIEHAEKAAAEAVAQEREKWAGIEDPEAFVKAAKASNAMLAQMRANSDQRHACGINRNPCTKCAYDREAWKRLEAFDKAVGTEPERKL